MGTEFIGNGKLSIVMPQHIGKVIEDFGEDLSTDAVNPAKSKLFTVDPEPELLSEAKADTFHSLTAKLLWIGKRARPDSETAVSFLCTRVHAPTTEDWGKLHRAIKFLKRTTTDKRIMGADNILKLESSWVDASYAVHDNMRGHTGRAMSFGWGVVHEKASKQKINAQSSTEFVVGVSEYVPHKVQIINFLIAQRYNIMAKCILYQDN